MSPDTAKDQVETLMNEGFGFAEQLLCDHGGFHPFAVVLTLQGEVRHVAAWDGRELPPSGELADLLTHGLRVHASEYLAVALFRNVTVAPEAGGPERDAVHAVLEHSSGYCVDVFLPYVLGEGDLAFEPLFATPGSPSVFSAG